MNDSTEDRQQAGSSEEEGFFDYDFERRETTFPVIPAGQQDVKRLLRAIFTDNDQMSVVLGKYHAFVGGAGETLFCWLRVRKETSSEMQLEIVTKDEDYRDGLRMLMEIRLYRIGENKTRLSMRSFSASPPVVNLHECMNREIRQAWVSSPQPATTLAPSEQEPMPLLPNKATPEQWDAWFDWYYRQAWGPTPNKLEHMAKLSGKARSTVENMHANHMADKR